MLTDVGLCSEYASDFSCKGWVDKEPIFLMRMKNQQKIKALLNGTVWYMWSNGQKCRVLVLLRSRRRGIL